MQLSVSIDALKFVPEFDLFSPSLSDPKQVSIILREQKVQTIADYWL